MVKEKLSDGDTEIATTSCKVSLACPLGKMRMKIPARAATCDHLQCFDAQLYLMMNEKKPKWECPVCQKKNAEPMSLQIDGFFLDLVQSSRLPPDEHEININQDASWTPLNATKSNPQDNLQSKRPRSRRIESSISSTALPKLSPKVSLSAKRTIAQSPSITLEEISEVPPRNNKRQRITSESKPVQEIECIDID